MSAIRRIQNLMQQYASRPEVAYIVAYMVNTARPDSDALSSLFRVNRISGTGLPFLNIRRRYSDAAMPAKDVASYAKLLSKTKKDIAKCPLIENYGEADSIKQHIALTAFAFNLYADKLIDANYKRTTNLRFALKTYLLLTPAMSGADWYSDMHQFLTLNVRDLGQAGEELYPWFVSGLNQFRYDILGQLAHAEATRKNKEYDHELESPYDKLPLSALKTALEYDEEEVKSYWDDPPAYDLRRALIPEVTNYKRDREPFFPPSMFKNGKYDILMPWLGKVVNAWVKTADKLEVMQLDWDEVNSGPCWTQEDWRGFQKLSGRYTRTLDPKELLAYPPLQPYLERVKPFVLNTFKSAVHHISLERLYDYLPILVDWASDPRTSVDFMRLSVGEAVRAAKAHARKKLQEAEVIEDRSILFRFENVIFLELTRADQLKREGEVQSHCVGNYCDLVAEGKTQIVSMRDATTRKIIATIEIDRTRTKPRVLQVMKKANRPLDKAEERKAFVAFVAYLDLELGSGYGGDLKDQYGRELETYKNQTAQTETAVLAGLWSLESPGIHEFLSTFGRR